MAHANPGRWLDHDPPMPPELAVSAEPLSPLEVEVRAAEHAGELIDDAVRPPWAITDDYIAEWAMRKLADLERQERDLRDKRDDWIARITHWFDQAAGPIARQASFFRHHLGEYVREQRQRAGRNSIALPSGRVGSRRVPASVQVVNPDAVLAALPEDAYRAVLKRSVSLSDLQAITVIGHPFIVALSCEHTAEVLVDDPPEEAQAVPCEECGSPQTVVSVTVGEPVVLLKTTRTPVLGAIVQPEKVSVSVKPS